MYIGDGAVATGGATAPSWCCGAICAQAGRSRWLRPEVPNVCAKLSDVHPELPDVRSVSSDGAGQGRGGMGGGVESRFDRPVWRKCPQWGVPGGKKWGKQGVTEFFFTNFAEVRHRLGH